MRILTSAKAAFRVPLPPCNSPSAASAGSAVLRGLLASLLFALPLAAADNWEALLKASGMPPGFRDLFVVRDGVEIADWSERVERGAILILEGASQTAESAGFKLTNRRIAVRQIVDLHRPALPIVWEQAVTVPVFEIPTSATMFAREKWEEWPVLAGYRKGAGIVLWMACSPGPHAIERYPFLMQAFRDLGIEPPLRSSRLWAFFDSAYRLRADPDYLAIRWRKAGIAALQVSAWYYLDRDPGREEFLQKLIQACHRRNILVYAWLELPHVSDKFWESHPEWREKTALGADAQLDWRKLMNLANRDCAKAVAEAVHALLGRFDWDGVNLAELYFESLEGHANPSRFTPLNEDVRFEFKQRHSFDPIELFQPASSHHYSKDQAGLKAFLDFRAELAQRLQTSWLGEIERVRAVRPDLDLVLTHVDDRLDPNTRDRIGAESARLLPLLDRQDFTFLIEDPATTWNLGPSRYSKIAERYRVLTSKPQNLAVDINIVERYQDVYPTKQQTGGELLQEIHSASEAFGRVALYFENSILPPDFPLLASAAAVAGKLERSGPVVTIDSPRGVGLSSPGPVTVNGRVWPLWDGATAWLPPGRVEVAPAATPPSVQLLDFNGDLKGASVRGNSVELAYESSARALVTLAQTVHKLEIDGVSAKPDAWKLDGRTILPLPRGQHLVLIEVQ